MSTEPVPAPDRGAAPHIIRPAGKPSAFRALLGYHTAVWREGYCEIALDLDGRHANSLGIVHGGVYATIIDAAMGHSATWCSVAGNVRPLVTLTLSTSYLSPPGDSHLIATARLVGAEGRIATCSAEVRDGSGRLCATAQGQLPVLGGW